VFGLGLGQLALALSILALLTSLMTSGLVGLLLILIKFQIIFQIWPDHFNGKPPGG